MSISRYISISYIKLITLSVVVGAIVGCSSTDTVPADQRAHEPDYDYLIGPGDSVEIFVWGNQELSAAVQVRPDGKITTKLVENIEASGKTPSELARHIEEVYSEFVKRPVVTVIVGGFIGVPWQQVRVVGEASDPRNIPYRKHMTLLDLMIDVGGLTEYADGNDAVLIRNFNNTQSTHELRIEDLIKDGDISANITMYPGDIVIIPEAWF